MAMNSTGIGQMTCGKWKFVQEIGRGAYGVVYRALGPVGEHAAVKVCRRDAVGDECYERELRGAKLFRSIPPQEGLVRMRDLVETDWGFYAVLDLADDEFGGLPNSSDGYRPKTLARVIAGEKALPLKECVKLAISLANGLSALQRHHLLHRDIKPGNVIYVGGRPVLSDPGLLIEESDAVSLVGTPGYVPPERFTDAASDIYSLGLTLKAASFGRQVDELDKGPAMEADTGAVCFPAWWRILNKATDPVASRRYQSAKAMLKDVKILCIRMGISGQLDFTRVASALAMIFIFIVVIAIIWRLRDEDSAENEPVESVKTEVQRISNVGNVADFLQKASGSISVERNCRQLTQCLRHTKACTYDTNLVARIDSARAELSALKEKGKEHAESFAELRMILEKKGIGGADATQEIKAIKELVKEEQLLNAQIFEIAGRFYDKWRPSPFSF